MVVPSQPADIHTPIPDDIPAWPPLRFGDEILSVNGKSIDSIRSDIRKYVSCSNETAVGFRTTVYAFTSTDADEYVVEYRRGNATDTVRIATRTDRNAREFIDFPKYAVSEEGCMLINDRIGYIDAAQFSNEQGRRIMNVLKNTEAIIIPLPGGYDKTITHRPIRQHHQSGGIYRHNRTGPRPNGGSTTQRNPAGVRISTTGRGTHRPWAEPTPEGLLAGRDEVLEAAIRIAESMQ